MKDSQNPCQPPEKVPSTDVFFSSRMERAVWIGLALFFIPFTTYLRCVNLANPLVEPHPWRQLQTALPISDFVEKGPNLLDYRSPLEGQLWFPIYEFPFYQWVVSESVRAFGSSIERTSRWVNLLFFIAGFLGALALIQHLCGTKGMAWFALLYWVLPFNVIFSRVCLIDHCALFFLLAYLWCYLASVSARRARFLTGMALGTVLGIFASTVKVQIWYIPTLALSLFLAYGVLQRKISYARAVILSAGLGTQLAFAIAWLRWSNALKGSSTGVLSDGGWYFGSLASRWDPQSWSVLGEYLFRWILDDWLILPFILGVIVLWKRPPFSWLLLLLTFVPVAIMWNVHLKHDYYMIGYLPFIVYLTAIGIAWLFERPGGWKTVVLGAMAFLLCFRVSKHAVIFEPLYMDYRSEILDAFELRAWTDPADVILTRGYEGQFRFPFYGERRVATWHHVMPKQLIPSVYLFNGDAETRLMAHEKEIWIEGNRRELLFYRARAAGTHQWDPKRHLSVGTTEKSGMRTLSWTGEKLTIDSCHEPIQLRAPEHSARRFVVQGRDSQTLFQFPSKEFIRFPKNSAWGCHFEIRLESLHS